MLRITLSSLAAQVDVQPEGIEVIVVDNNSSDHTRAVVEAAAATWPLGQLRYVFEGRQGKQFALNAGVREALHEVLAFTDDDIHFSRDWLLNIQNLFRDPGVDLAGGKTLIDWDGVQRPVWYRDDMLAVLAGVDDGEARLDPAPPTFAPGGSNLIARRSTFTRFGLYSELHFRHMDHEFGTRCHAQGARVVYEPSLVVWAPVDARCLTPRYFKRWSFKAGIARTGGVSATGLRPQVPAWMYRRIVQDVARMVLVRVESPADWFAGVLRLCRDLGAISNAWHAYLRPDHHAEWVKRMSQKKAGLY